MTIVANDSLPKIACVLKRFPRLSKTFIRNEIHEPERRGASVEIFSLGRPEELASDEAVARLKDRMSYLPQRRWIMDLPPMSGRCSDAVFKKRSLREMFRGAGPRRARARLETAAGAAGGANHGGGGVR